jgi:hypothetical protein
MAFLRTSVAIGLYNLWLNFVSVSLFEEKSKRDRIQKKEILNECGIQKVLCVYHTCSRNSNLPLINDLF